MTSAIVRPERSRGNDSGQLTLAIRYNKLGFLLKDMSFTISNFSTLTGSRETYSEISSRGGVLPG